MSEDTPTELIYMTGFDIYECEAVVVDKGSNEHGNYLILDKTCFYPKGGGQDFDTGVIESDMGDIKIGAVFLDQDGVVHHYYEGYSPVQVGEEVTCKVDVDRRKINTQLHSGGHVIDMAISEVVPEWTPGKGAHYPHMSFVEYDGEPAEDMQSLKEQIQQKIDELLSSGIENSVELMSREELEKVCRHVPEFLPSNKPTRVVMYGDFGVPCGGTHVSKLANLPGVRITKLKKKDGNIRVSYTVGD